MWISNLFIDSRQTDGEEEKEGDFKSPIGSPRVESGLGDSRDAPMEEADNDKMDLESSSEIVSWPTSKALNHRVKRLVRLYTTLKKKQEKDKKIEEKAAKEKERKEKKTDFVPEWSRREKQDLYRALQAYGIPTTPEVCFLKQKVCLECKPVFTTF